ncbi:MAG: DUF1292 domain-containing protein [Chloroflexi bacterium]|nr:MAG: DUF1292 domain-containing protein [Chloroflexota bacterium]
MTEKELPKTVTLIDEDGKERDFALHDAFDVEGVTYYLVEDAADPELVLLLREEKGRLATIEGEEFDRILSIMENESDA